MPSPAGDMRRSLQELAAWRGIIFETALSVLSLRKSQSLLRWCGTVPDAVFIYIITA
jgi:hypothetical protein